MKALLLIGASLMAGAGIYGYADYKKANLKKEFQSLYREEPPKVAQEAVSDIATPAPPEVEPVPTDVPVYVVKNGEVVAEEMPGKVETPVKAVKKDLALEEKKLEAISKKYEKMQKKHTIKAVDFSRAALEQEEIILPETEGKVKQ
jgi:hypothetical protein